MVLQFDSCSYSLALQHCNTLEHWVVMRFFVIQWIKRKFLFLGSQASPCFRGPPQHLEDHYCEKRLKVISFAVRQMQPVNTLALVTAVGLSQELKSENKVVTSLVSFLCCLRGCEHGSTVGSSPSVLWNALTSQHMFKISFLPFLFPGTNKEAPQNNFGLHSLLNE